MGCGSQLGAQGVVMMPELQVCVRVAPPAEPTVHGDRRVATHALPRAPPRHVGVALVRSCPALPLFLGPPAPVCAVARSGYTVTLYE
jgi:hypothetical protein